MKTKIHYSIYCLAFMFLAGISTNMYSQSIWEKYNDNPVLDVGENDDWDEYGAFVPRVITHNSTYKFKMYYTGQKNNMYQIGYATSSDGIRWQKHNSNPVIGLGEYNAWDRNRAADAVLDVDGVLKLWYSAWDIDESEYKIGYAWSEDGLEWNLNTEPVLEKGVSGEWDEKSVSASSVLFNGTVYYMWYTGTSIENRTNIGYAESYDGINWLKSPRNPVLTGGEDGSFSDEGVHMPTVMYDEGKYKMWFNGNDGTRYRIGYAESANGLDWDVFPYPVLNQGDFSQWDRSSLFGHSVLKQGSTYKIWYSGFNMWHWRTGYAEGNEVFSVPDDFSSISDAVENINDGGHILVKPGTYYDNIELDEKSVSITSNFVFSGDTNDIYNTILDGSRSKDFDFGSTVYFNNCPTAESELIGFTITGGSGTLSNYGNGGLLGGGIFCVNSTATIKHNRIINNKCIADEYFVCGGGIFAEDTTGQHLIIFEDNLVCGNIIVNTNSTKSYVTGGGVSILSDAIIANNTIKNNMTFHAGGGQALGGGIEVYGYSLRVENNVIKDNILENTNSNFCPWGGGLFGQELTKGSVISGNTITGNKIIGSTSRGGGIGIWKNSSPLLIDKNIISENKAKEGGGIAIGYDEKIQLTNNFIHSNIGIANGGGIYLRDIRSLAKQNLRMTGEEQEVFVNYERSSELLCQIINNTIFENHSNGYAGGIYAYYALDYFLTMNNILYGNTSVFAGSEIYLNYNANTYLFHNNVDPDKIAGSGDCISSGNIFYNPELRTDGHLDWTSPCANRGICMVNIDETCYQIPSTDIDGEDRPYYYTLPDIGADESEILSVSTPDIADDQLSLEAYPNPFSDFVDIKLNLKGESKVKLVLINSMGQVVASYSTELEQNDLNQFQIDGTQLPAGLYFGEIQIGTQTQSIKLIKIN